jgi:hypothetical protein
MVAGFDTYKMDYANRLAAAGGGGSITIDTSGAGTQADYAPQATSTSVGGQINVDNRFQTVTVSSTTGVVAGDAFKIAGVFAVHHITKQSTGQLKTFRVVSVDSGTTMTITPPIIGAQAGATDAQKQYKNVDVAVASNTSAITFLNVNAASVNVFWQRDSLEILPGRYAVPPDAGVAVMRATTDQGIELVLQKFYDIDSMTIKYRMDTLFGVVNKNPRNVGHLTFQSIIWPKNWGASAPLFAIGEPHAIDQRLFKQVHQQEHQDGKEGRQANEASRGHRSQHSPAKAAGKTAKPMKKKAK